MPKFYLSRMVGSRVLVKPVKDAREQWGTILKVDYEYPLQNVKSAIRASTFFIKLDEGGTVASLGLYFIEV